MTADAFDDDAEVLARMSAQGDDLTRPRRIEFAHVFSDASAADAFRACVEGQGYMAVVEGRDDATSDVIVQCHMTPALEPLTGIELALAETAREYGGEPDGWGCFSVPKLQA